jgi:hypothetical protein
MFVLSDTHVLAPDLINVARFGFIRFDGSEASVDPITGPDVGMQTPDLPVIRVSLILTFYRRPPFQLSYFENTNTFVWQDISLSPEAAFAWARGQTPYS